MWPTRPPSRVWAAMAIRTRTMRRPRAVFAPDFIARLKCGLYRPCKLNQLKGAAVLSFLDK